MNPKSLDAGVMRSTGSGWVLVFPRGKHYIDKYDLVLNCDDKFFESVKQWWEGSTFKKPYLDKGHEFNERYGEFTEYRVTDKGLEMFLSLNEAGKELIKSGTYEYLSPTFKNATDSTGKEFQNVIYTVSLVNSPALLVLDKIQNQIALSGSADRTAKDNKKTGGSKMELNQRIAGMLKLNLASDDGSILAKIEELINSGATIEDLKSEIEKLKGALTTVTAQAEESEMEKKKALEALEKIQADALELEAVNVIDLAIKDGQYHPALKEMKLEQYKTNPEMVKKELSILPKADGKKQLSVLGNGEGALELSDEDKAILLDAGYDLTKAEDLALAKAYLKGNGGN